MLNSFTDKYLFTELLELVDLNLHAMGDPDGCPRFHFMPRFVRKLAGLLLKNIQLEIMLCARLDQDCGFYNSGCKLFMLIV